MSAQKENSLFLRGGEDLYKMLTNRSQQDKVAGKCCKWKILCTPTSEVGKRPPQALDEYMNDLIMKDKLFTVTLNYLECQK